MRQDLWYISHSWLATLTWLEMRLDLWYISESWLTQVYDAELQMGEPKWRFILVETDVAFPEEGTFTQKARVLQYDGF